MDQIVIRKEWPKDFSQVRKLNEAVFEADGEAKLVDILRDSNINLISLVAEENDVILGHILFSPVQLSNNLENVAIAGLAPMAVFPDYQKKGIGSALVQKGLEYCREAAYKAVVVLGHPEYYPKFGFVPSVQFNIKSEYDVPENVFMVQELEKGALKNCSGVISYHEAFGNV
ncbi:MAG: N-acetyltransferase [Bacteroidota bacterium]